MWLETEIEAYNDYLEHIRLLISKESTQKFKKTIEPDKINLKDISKTRALDDYFDTDITKWVFYYDFTVEKVEKVKPNTSKTAFKTKSVTSGMSKQISFNEWKRLKLVNDRNEKLKQIGL